MRKSVLAIVLLFTSLLPFHAAFAAQPNVILIMTDDQGYGDIAAHGNTIIQTPHLDRLHSQSVRLTDYHVDPTCSPTRAALMTGRYSTKTGVWHTIAGRSLMAHDEVTLAELFRGAGYRTGISGKWHLGDVYPMRAMDRGFDASLVHGGGGVTQTPDYWGNDYFDDTYFRNGEPEKFTGYCTDVFFDNALKFIEASGGRPFFCYIPTNAPHGPFNVADTYSEPYKAKGVPSPMAEFYGMITNIDENVGKLRARLDELGLAENTVLIFTTDNGTAAGMARPRNARNPRKRDAPDDQGWKGFNAGMRASKGSQYDGGHRVPCFFHWPAGKLTGGRDVPQLTAHIDMMPTLAEICGLKLPERDLDGRSLVPLLNGNRPNQGWPQRTLVVHSQRIEHPQKWKTSAVMTERWRLIDGKELYDIEADPGQENDLAASNAEVVAKLREAYEAWWKELTPALDRDVPLVIGGEQSPVQITAHDWHPDLKDVPWNQEAIARGPMANGYWIIQPARPGKYEFTLRRWPIEKRDGTIEAVEAGLKVGDLKVTQKTSPGDEGARFTLDLKSTEQMPMQAWLTLPDGQTRGAFYVVVRRLD